MGTKRASSMSHIEAAWELSKRGFSINPFFGPNGNILFNVFNKDVMTSSIYLSRKTIIWYLAGVIKKEKKNEV